MNVNEAIELITFDTQTSFAQRWLDLGCGSGLFTVALARQLPAFSTIVAIDKVENDLKQIPKTVNGVGIETRVADFVNDDLLEKDLHGILMANSFHYVKDKNSFLDKLVSLMKKNSFFLLVEYDLAAANPWVPYPLSLNAAKELFKIRGFSIFHLLGKRPSVYGSRQMYAALIS